MRLSFPPRPQSAFTLLETMVVIALLSVLLALGLFMNMDTFRGTVYRSEEDVIVSLFQKARSRAMNNIDQTAWGVCYIAPNYVLFTGSACVAGAITDRIPANLGVASSSDFQDTFPVVVFTQLSGTTTATTTTVIQDASRSVISINNEGTILW